MVPLLPLPRFVFGAGMLTTLAEELSLLGIRRPLLLSDRGLEHVGAVAKALRWMPEETVQHLDVPENLTVAGADAARRKFDSGRCDGVVALGGGSVLDTGKLVAALTGSGARDTASLLGRPDLIGWRVSPLIAIPTTLGTGSESSPVAALHRDQRSPAVGTRSPHLVPRTAICDPELTYTLPPRMVAATGIDAISHCIEGFLAEPANAIVDALALDGLSRAFENIRAATRADGETARAQMMAAAFAGGAAIHKGLGPAHAIAIVCGDQGLHHGVLIAAALPLTVALVASHAPEKAARIAGAMGLSQSRDLPKALGELPSALGLPSDFRAAGYKAGKLEDLVNAILQSHFNRTSPYVPTYNEYLKVMHTLLR